jgi:hypothetical protein
VRGIKNQMKLKHLTYRHNQISFLYERTDHYRPLVTGENGFGFAAHNRPAPKGGVERRRHQKLVRVQVQAIT